MHYDPFSCLDHYPDATVKSKCSRILQSKLARFLELRELKQEFDALREELLELHLQGAKQEVGALNLSVRERSLQVMSFTKLVKLLGEARAAAIRDRIEPTVSHVVTVDLAM